MPSGKGNSAGVVSRVAHLDAVTVDAMGTLVELDDPVGRLGQALRDRSVERNAEDVATAFAAEVEYYIGHKLAAADRQALVDLRRECTRVFLETGKIDLDPGDFAPSFVAAIAFRPLDGAVEALERLRAAGLSLACVSAWATCLRSCSRRRRWAQRSRTRHSSCRRLNVSGSPRLGRCTSATEKPIAWGLRQPDSLSSRRRWVRSLSGWECSDEAWTFDTSDSRPGPAGRPRTPDRATDRDRHHLLLRRLSAVRARHE